MGRPQAPSIGTRRWKDGDFHGADDQLAAEEPLQLSLNGKPLSILMRTPGHDLELGLGLLWAERVITSLDQVLRVQISAEASEAAPSSLSVAADLIESNQIDFHLRVAKRIPQRSFIQSSACGVCGATTVESLALDFPVVPPGPTVRAELLPHLAVRLREQQRLFDHTGGLHAAGLFTAQGEPVLLREDVGRHNAVDKVVGRAMLDGLLPLHSHVLVVSGRGGYEIIQKAVAAGIPVVAAVGAPSSLAVQTARRFAVTLVGFLREGRFNIYSAPERII